MNDYSECLLSILKFILLGLVESHLCIFSSPREICYTFSNTPSNDNHIKQLIGSYVVLESFQTVYCF